MNLSAILAATLTVLTALGAAANAQTIIEAEDARLSREQHFVALVKLRSAAIENAFGPLFGGSGPTIRLKFVASAGSPAAPASYDAAQRTLIFRRSVLGAMREELPPALIDYWPYYGSAEMRALFPVVAVIDEALWNAHLEESAHHRGMTWPHAGCGSTEIAQRLGCEMLVAGASEFMHSVDGPMFNANRIDRLWPENLDEFSRRASRHHSQEYLDVQRLGGVLLIRPLIHEFGAPRVLSYVAQTPFRIENNNVRLSALHYQERVRTALRW